MTTPYYSDEFVTLYLGDCLEVTEWLAAAVLVTDPPYGIRWSRGANSAAMGTKPRGRASHAHDGIAGDQSTEVRDGALAAWGDLPGVVFGSLYAAFPEEYVHVGIYEKPPDSGVVGSTLGLRRDIECLFFVGRWPRLPPLRGSVFRSRIASSGNPYSPAGRYGHPHAKPGDLMAELIDLSPPGVIADPFAGSGSTLVAAKALGRKAIGVELEERYCETSARRLSQGVLDLTGEAS
jgi:site-specific DNA-methyltransferase (adenine-specific)